MAWTEFTDELGACTYDRVKCHDCKKGIPRDSLHVTRRGLFNGTPTTATLHNGCGDPPADGVAPEDGASDEARAASEEPETEAADKAGDSPPAAETPAGEPPITVEQKDKLKHYAEIKERNEEVLAAFWEWEAAHAHAAALKKDLESMRKDLNQFIKRGKDPQRDLDFPDSDGEGSSAAPAAAGEPEWKGRPLSVLGLSEALIARLAENAIETLGHLKAFWDEGRVLTSLKGVGEEKNAAVADAWAAYAKDHQEVYGLDGGAAADGDEAHDDDPFKDDAPSGESADAKSPDVETTPGEDDDASGDAA